MRGLRPPLWILPRTVLRDASTVEQKGLSLCGGFQRGAGAPLCVVAEEGVTGEKPHRKGFSLRACFCLLFPRGKSRSGCGAEGPMVLRAQPRQQKNLSSPLGTKGSPSAVPPAFAPAARAHAPVTEGLRPALTGRSRANKGPPSRRLSADGRLSLRWANSLFSRSTPLHYRPLYHKNS